MNSEACSGYASSRKETNEGTESNPYDTLLVLLAASVGKRREVLLLANRHKTGLVAAQNAVNELSELLVGFRHVSRARITILGELEGLLGLASENNTSKQQSNNSTHLRM